MAALCVLGLATPLDAAAAVAVCQLHSAAAAAAAAAAETGSLAEAAVLPGAAVAEEDGGTVVDMGRVGRWLAPEVAAGLGSGGGRAERVAAATDSDAALAGLVSRPPARVFRGPNMQPTRLTCGLWGGQVEMGFELEAARAAVAVCPNRRVFGPCMVQLLDNRQGHRSCGSRGTSKKRQRAFVARVSAARLAEVRATAQAVGGDVGAAAELLSGGVV